MVDLKRCMANMKEAQSQIFQKIGKIEFDLFQYRSGLITLEELEDKYKHLLPSRK